MNNTKVWYQSRTFWLAVTQAIAGALTIFASAYPQLGYLLLAKSALDIYLRATTDTALTTLSSLQQ